MGILGRKDVTLLMFFFVSFMFSVGQFRCVRVTPFELIYKQK